MNYSETIDYLFTRLPMFSRIGVAAFKKDLTNTLALCKFLGDPHTKFKSVHIGGTNGKGSTSHMLAAVFQAAGYKIGLYTSPHLKDFRERIKINGEMVAEKFVINFVEKIRPQIDMIEPSFFEITVAMAFDYFAQQHVDIAIVEVGLGGRLDSTNIIQPELSIITNISYDHMNMLGDTLDKIAFEKAGIIKKNTPVVIGETHPETYSVFLDKATKENAPLHLADKKRFVAEWRFNKHELVAELTSVHNNEKNYYHLDLEGIYQLKNLVTVAESIQILQQKGFPISEMQIQKGLRQVKKLTGLHGRWDIIHEDPSVVLDVGHNEDGIREIVRQIEITDHENLHIVLGMVKDKEIEKILPELPKNATYYFTKAQIPRALMEEELAEKAKHAGLNGTHYPFVMDALRAAIQHAHKKDLIIVCGSVFVVGEVEVSEVREAFRH